MSHLQGILDEGPVRPKKSLGQNFLADPVYLRKIADAAALSQADVVLEIGPGTGNLTEHLLARAGRVVAVELDPRMVRLLEGRFAGNPGLTLVHADILTADIGHLLRPHLAQGYTYKVVANLPYYITSAVLRLLLGSDVRPALAVLTVQWEVAQRICACPGEMSLLAVAVQWYAAPRIVTRVPAGAFTPAPKVDSAILRLDTRLVPPALVVDETLLFRVAKAGFSQRRKQLRNALSAGLGIPPEEANAALPSAGVDPRRRAETLRLEEWAALANAIAAKAPPGS